jgi:hypothetical protein
MKVKLLLVFLMLASLTSASVYGWTTSNLQKYYQNTDGFYNYDFISEDASDTNVDFTVNLVFWNNAEVDKVKVNFYGYDVANAMNMELKDGTSWVWDSDRGSATCKLGSNIRKHMRLYADSDDRMYDVDWGYYVIATSHYDYPCLIHDWSGYSEQAEEEIAQDARNLGHGVQEDKKYMYNLEPARNETSGGKIHAWYNNGWTTFIEQT